MTTVTAGQTYVQQFQSTGATGFELLGTVPTGTKIDSTGRLTWPTTTANIGSQPVEVEAVNWDELTSAPFNYTITVVADTAPTVQVEMGSSPTNLTTGVASVDEKSVVYFDVLAGDNAGVQSLSPTVGGTPVPLDANGRGLYTAPGTPGQLAVVAKATDVDGLAGTAPTATLRVVDPTDTTAPTVAITQLGSQAVTPTSPPGVITSPTKVIGTVTDSNLLPEKRGHSFIMNTTVFSKTP